MVDKKEAKKAIRTDIDASTIAEEIKLMYLMAGATMSVVEDVRKRIGNIYLKHGLMATHNEMLSGLNDFCKSVKQAGYHFYNRIDTQIISATWGIGCEEKGGNVEAYDGFNADQLEVVRLLMLYVDRTIRSQDAFSKVFKTLRQLPSQGVFKDEDIARFKQK